MCTYECRYSQRDVIAIKKIDASKRAFVIVIAVWPSVSGGSQPHCSAPSVGVRFVSADVILELLLITFIFKLLS